MSSKVVTIDTLCSLFRELNYGSLVTIGATLDAYLHKCHINPSFVDFMGLHDANIQLTEFARAIRIYVEGDCVLESEKELSDYE